MPWMYVRPLGLSTISFRKNLNWIFQTYHRLYRSLKTYKTIFFTSLINNIIPVSITLDVGKNEDKNEDKNVDDDKPICEYGLECYRKNPQHRKEYQHCEMSSKKPKCEYGQKCYRKNPQHIKKYQHWGTTSRKSSGTSWILTSCPFVPKSCSVPSIWKP